MFSAENEKDIVASWAAFGCRDYLLSFVCQNHRSKTKYQKRKHSQWAAVLNLDNICFCWAVVNCLLKLFHTERRKNTVGCFCRVWWFLWPSLPWAQTQCHSGIQWMALGAALGELLALTLKTEIAFYHWQLPVWYGITKASLEVILGFSW